MSVGLGALAFKLDLPGYRLGWRQLASMAAAAGLAVAALPMLGASGGGRWHLPQQDFGGILTFAPGGSFRVLWVGDPRALPLGSWQYETGVGYATSTDGAPDATNQWPPQSAGASPLLATDLHLASARLTTQLGHLLAPMAVRYIIIPTQTAPAGSGGTSVPVPNDILAGLGQQTDLKALPVDDSLVVYQNAAWAPGAALLAPAAAAAAQATTPAASQSVALSGSTSALTSGDLTGGHGQVPANGQVLVSATDQAGWHLSVAGQGASRQRAFGWAMLFNAPSVGGTASLRYDTPPATRGLLVLEVALWLAAIGALVADWRRRAASGRASSEAAPEEPRADVNRPLTAGVSGARRPRAVTVPAIDEEDEMWT
jgi:hypothetical protein